MTQSVNEKFPHGVWEQEKKSIRRPVIQLPMGKLYQRFKKSNQAQNLLWFISPR